MSGKILHIGGYNKFTKPFIGFVKDNFEFNTHLFLLTSDQKEPKPYPNVHLFERAIISRFRYYVEVAFRILLADKVVLHGLFDKKLILFFYLNPFVLKKCYWIILGGDLYAYKNKRDRGWYVREVIRKAVMKRIGHLLTYIPGDVEVLRGWCGATGEYHECLMYLSNIVTIETPNINIKRPNVKAHRAVQILVGNSADPSNNHFEVLEKISAFKEREIKVFVPLSYGDPAYAEDVIKYGAKLLGDKFIPLTTFMNYQDYLIFLEDIDLVVFNHNRQQAMGNTISLLAMGKTVYLRNDVSQWTFFSDMNITCFNVDSFSLSLLSDSDRYRNRVLIREFFCYQRLLEQYSRIFNL